MTTTKCPFCNAVMSLGYLTSANRSFNFYNEKITNTASGPYLSVSITKCPNCEKETVSARGINGYIDNLVVPIYPRAIYRQFPEYVPTAIRSDYAEASTIVDSSPKAAATLARRCLQGMIHDFWNIHEKNLNAEITQLKGKIPAAQWKAIDAIRSIGNIGAHMEHDVNLIIDVDPDESRKLILLIEHLIEKWYINRHEEEALYEEIASIGKAKSDARQK